MVLLEIWGCVASQWGTIYYTSQSFGPLWMMIDWGHLDDDGSYQRDRNHWRSLL